MIGFKFYSIFNVFTLYLNPNTSCWIIYLNIDIIDERYESLININGAVLLIKLFL